MILHPIIDLLERIVVALPDYAGGGELPEGMSHTGSGEILFASRTSADIPIEHGLNFTPKAIIIWTNTQIADDNDIFYCLLTRYLANNIGTTKAERFLVDRITSDTGVELLTYSSAFPTVFITNNLFNIGHGSKYYEAGATYNWFAFD